MIAEVFLDTNILLYACSDAPADTDKQAIAEKLIIETNFALSAQVLQEFVANALRKKVLGITERWSLALTRRNYGHEWLKFK